MVRCGRRGRQLAGRIDAWVREIRLLWLCGNTMQIRDRVRWWYQRRSLAWVFDREQEPRFEMESQRCDGVGLVEGE